MDVTVHPPKHLDGVASGTQILETATHEPQHIPEVTAAFRVLLISSSDLPFTSSS